MPCRHCLLSRCCKGLQTVNHRGVAQWRKKIYISRFMFQHIKPPDKQEDKHLHCRQQISHSGRTTRPLWCPSAVWCFLHRTYGGWKGWLNVCYCFPSAFKNHPGDTRLLYILMTIRVIRLWFITKRFIDLYHKEVASPAGQLVKKWIDTWPGSWGQWGRTSLKSHGQEPCGPSATTYVDHCNSQKTISAIHILNILHIFVLT